MTRTCTRPPTASAAALRAAGVVVVALGNNHQYDAPQHGVRRTVDALESRGHVHGRAQNGLGRDEAAAWRPALFSARGQRFPC